MSDAPEKPVSPLPQGSGVPSRAEQVRQARAQVEQLLASLSAIGEEIDYERSVIPLSAEMLLSALIAEGKLDLEEMQLRQLVIQGYLLSHELALRTAQTNALRRKPRPPQIAVPAHVRRTKLN